MKTDNASPLLSIVIVNYNYGRFLEAAIRSVIDQNTSEVELIIVDGGSRDESVDIIKKYSAKISWWVSEPDKGQSDAFNKGFSHANGKYLTWLNSDDLLVPDCLRKIIHEFKTHPEKVWSFGISLSHWEDETYIYLSFFRWVILIGKFYH